MEISRDTSSRAETKRPRQRYEVPPPPGSPPLREPIREPIRMGGWIALLAVFGLLAGYLRQVEKMHRQQRELSASQLQLVETQQAYFALHIKHSTTEALMQQFQTQATHLAEAHAKLRQAEASLHTTNEQATAREQELQRLVVFLKDEIKASEAQVNELKELLKQRTEIKPAE